MSLGTIAHLQYYFARTGLLDGKGAQLAREKKDEEDKMTRQTSHGSADPLSPQNTSFLDPNISFDSGATSPLLASPEMSHSSNPADEPDPIAMPPTYSTYKKKPNHVAPPPSMSVLRRELREALEDAKKVLEAQQSGSEKEQVSGGLDSPARSSSGDDAAPTQGWHEIEGLHILDLITLAIRAAKNYYTSHDQPQRLYSISSERQIRSELYRVLDVLKRIGSRNFAGGYRPRETQEILRWISNIENLVTKDEKAERMEEEQRESWMWLNGNCAGHEREREWVFLKSFEPKGATIPVWTELTTEEQGPGPFLRELRDGIILVQLHNELVRNSWRQFGEIKTWHTDTNKPYRCMENLRYWIKAAQLRFDVRLDVDVSGVVNDKSFEAWRGFDAAILKWTRAVREELTQEWKEQKGSILDRPEVHIEPGGGEAQVV